MWDRDVLEDVGFLFLDILINVNMIVYRSAYRAVKDYKNETLLSMIIYTSGAVF